MGGKTQDTRLTSKGTAMKQSLDTKLMRTAEAMDRCDEDQPVDLCHIVTIREARDELSRLARENAQLLSDVRTLQAFYKDWLELDIARCKENDGEDSSGVAEAKYSLSKTLAKLENSGALTRWGEK